MDMHCVLCKMYVASAGEKVSCYCMFYYSHTDRVAREHIYQYYRHQRS